MIFFLMDKPPLFIHDMKTHVSCLLKSVCNLLRLDFYTKIFENTSQKLLPNTLCTCITCSLFVSVSKPCSSETNVCKLRRSFISICNNLHVCNVTIIVLQVSVVHYLPVLHLISSGHGCMLSLQFTMTFLKLFVAESVDKMWILL